MNPNPINLSPREIEDLLAICTKHIVDLARETPRPPVCDGDDAVEISRSLREGPPEGPTPYEDLIHQVFTTFISRGIDITAPGFLGYVVGGGLYACAAADLIASAINRPVAYPTNAPLLIQMEANVIRWFCHWLGLPTAARGTLTNGGTQSNFLAIAMARQKLLGDDIAKGTAYVSDQAHHSIVRGIRLAGIPVRNLRYVPSDHALRLDVQAAARSIADDKDRGLKPFIIIGNAGTTNTGAIDPLNEVADLARSIDMWCHVDAAYGGFFNLTERGHRRLTLLREPPRIVEEISKPGSFRSVA